MTTSQRARLALPLLVVLALAVGCGGAGSSAPGSGDTSSSSNSSAGGSGAVARAAAPEPAIGKVMDGAARSSDSSAGPAGMLGSTGALTRAVVSTGELTLRSGNLDRARSEIGRLVASWGGTIADEETRSDHDGAIVDSTLTLRIPSERFDAAMSALGRVGTVQHETRSSQDVTTQVIDVDARVRAAERSIREIENLLNRAKKLGDVIAIETDLARRQADLDSLRSQQAYLKDQTTLSTVNVYLTTRGAVHPAAHASTGFFSGLAAGWRALVSATAVLLTAVGAVLPFGLLAALVVVPLWLVVRRRRSRGAAGAVAAPATEPSA